MKNRKDWSAAIKL